MLYQNFSEQIEQALSKARAYLLSKYQISEPDLQDILQEASLQAIKNLGSFEERCSFDTWFISICRNEANAFFRRNKKNELHLAHDVSDEQMDSAWVEPEVIHNNEIEQCSHLINEALLKMSEKHRQIIEIVLKNSKSSQEIADILQIPLNSARTRLFYAKRRLKKLIEIYAHKSNVQRANH